MFFKDKAYSFLGNSCFRNDTFSKQLHKFKEKVETGQNIGFAVGFNF
jgi:hypothetical protein